MEKETEGKKMETKKIATKKQEKKVALIGMIIKDADAAEKVNEI